MLVELHKELQRLASADDAAHAQRYFKTGKGEYGEGDVFIGVRVPVLRRLARSYRMMPTSEVLQLLRSNVHEERLLALLLLIEHFRRGDEAERKVIADAYLRLTRYINNWDLVDVSAEKILGAYLGTRNRKVLDQLARSSNLWERRIGVMATLYFIRQGDFDDTLRIARMLLHDEHDLIHKAVGWMLREVGKRNRAVAEDFLRRHYHTMPRTMLRYAIEKYPPRLRQRYLQGKL